MISDPARNARLTSWPLRGVYPVKANLCVVNLDCVAVDHRRYPDYAGKGPGGQGEQNKGDDVPHDGHFTTVPGGSPSPKRITAGRLWAGISRLLRARVIVTQWQAIDQSPSIRALPDFAHHW